MEVMHAFVNNSTTIKGGFKKLNKVFKNLYLIFYITFKKHLNKKQNKIFEGIIKDIK